MLTRPKFKPHLRVEVVPGEGLFVLSEWNQTVLQGRLYELVTPHLDGRPAEDICDRLAGQAGPAEVYYTLRALETKGLLTEADDPTPIGEAAFWSCVGADPRQATRNLAGTPVSVACLGDIDLAPLRQTLTANRVRLTDTAAEAGFAVVATDHPLHPELPAINRAMLAANRPWLLVKPVGVRVWVGPLFRPRITGCWECLAQRLRSNFPVNGYLEIRNGRPTPPTDLARTPASEGIAWGLAATATTYWLARGESPLAGQVQTLDTVTGKSESHPVICQPACPACGAVPPTDRPATPVELRSRQKVYTADNGFRAAAPEETVRKYAHLVSPISGVVSMLEKPTDVGDGVMHVYVSGRNVARGPESWYNLQADLRSMSSGKGTTDSQAKASALCEGLERYSAVFRGDEPRRRATLRQLGGAAIHPNSCMLFSDRQYRERDRWNARFAKFHTVPVPFDPDVEMDWTPVWSLTHETERYVPTSHSYFWVPPGPGHEFCSACSNGNAAGNTLEEAILQGFLELVERDGVALWWYNRARVPALDLDSFDDPYIPKLRAYLRQHNRDLWALDLTTDLGIPVVVALSGRTDGGGEHLMFGFGAHLDPRLAVLRALTELNQMLAYILTAPKEDGAGPLADPETVSWLRTATRADHPYLLPREGPARTAADYPIQPTDDLRDDVLACRAAAERVGLEMLVLDQTRPEVGLPVVKVLVPGLRHFWARFAPGRLYDTPVKLGWLDRPRTEDELNPVPMFL